MKPHHYLKFLYQTYDNFQLRYKSMYKLSDKNKEECISGYYLRWRNKIRTEIKRVEMIVSNENINCNPCRISKIRK